MKNIKWSSFLIGIASSFIFFPASSSAFIPVPDENGEYSYDEQGNLVVGSDFSFSDMKELDYDCDFEADQKIIELAGYDPSLKCDAGDRPEDVLIFGYFDSYGFQKLSINEFNSDGEKITLDQVKIIHDLTIRELSNSVSGLEDYMIENIPLFRDSFPEYLHGIKLERILNSNAKELSEELKKRTYQKISKYTSSSINSNQTQVLQALEEGIDLATASINESINLDPSVQHTLNLDDINTALKIGLEYNALAAKKKLDREIDDFLSSNYDRTAEEINKFVAGKIAKYETSTETLIKKTFSNLKNITREEIINKTDLTSADIDWQEYEELFIDYEQIVISFGTELSTSTSTDTSDYTDQELEKIENIASTIPNNIGDLVLRNFELEKYTVRDIPGLGRTPIKNIEDYETAAISDVPGASDYPFSRLPSFNPNFGTGIAVIDLVFGTAEKYGDRAISGSLRETFNLAHCRELSNLKGCAHVELTGPIPFNRGKQWISGDSQRVRGGKNLLQFYGGGKEPTGRLPAYGSRLKMVLRNNDEQTDTTELYLALQFCFRDFFGVEHCTPHNVLEFPIHTFKVGDFIFLGITG